MFIGHFTQVRRQKRLHRYVYIAHCRCGWKDYGLTEEVGYRHAVQHLRELTVAV